MSMLPALAHTADVQQRKLFARARSTIPAASGKDHAAGSTFFKRAHSVEPCVEQQDQRATSLGRTRSTHKGRLSLEDIEQIKASTRKIMDSALLPMSQRVVLSIDKELGEMAERESSAHPRQRDVLRRRLAPLTTHGLRLRDEEQQLNAPPATLHDGKAMRRRNLNNNLSLSLERNAPEFEPFPVGIGHALDGEKPLRRSYPGAGLLLELKKDSMAPERRSQLHFEPETARQRGTYLFGLNGDIVKAHSLAAALPPTNTVATVSEEEFDEGQEVAARATPEASRSMHHTRAGLKTSGGTDWHSLSAEGREIRLKDDFGALLVQYKAYIHDLIVWNGLWYFKLPTKERDAFCVQISEIHREFKAIVQCQRPLESHNHATDPVSEKQLHEHLKEGQSSFITNMMLQDALRGDDELREFDVSVFKFSRRADWKKTSDLRLTIVDARETTRILKQEVENVLLKKPKAIWKRVRASLPELAKKSLYTPLPTDSRVGNALRDTLRDSTLDREAAVVLNKVIDHHKESKKLQADLDRTMTFQMDLKVQRKIDDIRAAMQSKHVTDATNISQNAFSQLKLMSMPSSGEEGSNARRRRDSSVAMFSRMNSV